MFLTSVLLAFVWCLCCGQIVVVTSARDPREKKGEVAVVLAGHPVNTSYGVLDEENFGGKYSLNQQHSFVFEYKRGKRIPGDELLLADTKSWKFPQQDVSLTLKYPVGMEGAMNMTFYVTEFRVFISQDSSDSKGLLVSGGPGHHHMELKFTAPEAELFTFDMRLYGIQSDLVSEPDDIFSNVISDPDDLEWRPV